jgi:hypothetical protein
VAKLAIKPTVRKHYKMNIASANEALFAVCGDLNEQIILTADTVRYLNSVKQYDEGRVLKFKTTVCAEKLTSFLRQHAAATLMLLSRFREMHSPLVIS